MCPSTVNKLPRLLRQSAEARQAVAAARRAGQTIGLVPTMGALHEGHLSLVERSCRECGYTVVSIFVNPAQFGPSEDLARYPRDLDRDMELLARLKVDAVFAPNVDEVYRPGHATFVEAGGVASPLEGERRPGHFRGVATVVLKLLNICAPDIAYFGLKDYQQWLVIRQMAADLDVPVELRSCPIVREKDGLALSSRNIYLNAEERRQALVLSRALQLAERLVIKGERDGRRIREQMLALFAAEPAVKLDYLILANPDTLEEVVDVGHGAVALVAARVGTTRLIDNTLLAPPT